MSHPILRRLVPVLAALGAASCVPEESGVLTDVYCSWERYEVDSLEEGQSPGLCLEGECTVEDALLSAASCSVTHGRKTVVLQGTTYYRTRGSAYAGPTDRIGFSALVAHVGDVVIEGNGAHLVGFGGVLDEHEHYDGMRGLAVLAPARLEIRDLTITGFRLDPSDQEVGPPAGGGGILNEGELVLDGVTVRGNSVEPLPRVIACTHNGGGIDNRGHLDLIDSDVVANVGACHGGGIASREGSLRVRGSLVARNRAHRDGGGLHLQFPLDEVEIAQSAIVDNLCSPTASGETLLGSGGGIFALGAYDSGIELVVRSTTISGNAAGADGGISASNQVVTSLHDATVARNTSAVAHQPSGVTAAELEATNSLLVENGPGPNCGAIDGTTRASLSDDGSCGLPDVGYAGLRDLAPAGGNGLPVHALDSRSPALDAGTGCLREDQRGVARPYGDCDVGAYELHPGDGGEADALPGWDPDPDPDPGPLGGALRP